ncbi:MAG: hypothetical protein C0390_13360, partial [Syntrophus sp. (in: bacteria)]|nr:hypothetical protein [Syntrophus sp. (in: bacteria)]
RMPILRGHCTVPEDLIGVTWRDWYADAEAALLDLSREVEKTVIVGLSAGGLVTLNLAIEHADLLAGVVTVAAALRFADPLVALTPILTVLVKMWPPKVSPPKYADPELAKYDNNYPYFPIKAFASLLKYAGITERRLPQVKVPILVIHSHQDTTIQPISAEIIYNRVSSAEKRIAWFEKSSHEMMRDCEREAVFNLIEEFVLQKKGASTK